MELDKLGFNIKNIDLGGGLVLIMKLMNKTKNF